MKSSRRTIRIKVSEYGKVLGEHTVANPYGPKDFSYIVKGTLDDGSQAVVVIDIGCKRTVYVGEALEVDRIV